MKLIKVKDHPELRRHADSQAIVNIDKTALHKYREERDQRLRLKHISDDYESFKQEHEVMKSDIAEIKDLLHQLLRK